MNIEILIWHIWVIVSILLLIAEVFVPTFTLASFAIGCLMAGIFSAMDYGIKIQLIAFSVGMLASFFMVRPFMLKYAYRQSNNVKTNVEALVGKTGRVIETIHNAENQGRVIVNGDDWKAEAENDEIIETGSKIQVLEINSTILIVKSLNKN
jgi:membrane protein implicated in regulation of membrane protease activity